MLAQKRSGWQAEKGQLRILWTLGVFLSNPLQKHPIY